MTYVLPLRPSVYQSKRHRHGILSEKRIKIFQYKYIRSCTCGFIQSLSLTGWSLLTSRGTLHESWPCLLAMFAISFTLSDILLFGLPHLICQGLYQRADLLLGRLFWPHVPKITISCHGFLFNESLKLRS